MSRFVHVVLFVALPCASCLLFDPSMQDVLEFSKGVKSAGELYNREASAMPTEPENMKTLMIENAQTIGSIDQTIAAEIAADVSAEHTACAVCERGYSSVCPKLWSKVSGGMCIAPDSYSGQFCKLYEGRGIKRGSGFLQPNLHRDAFDLLWGGWKVHAQPRHISAKCRLETKNVMRSVVPCVGLAPVRLEVRRRPRRAGLCVDTTEQSIVASGEPCLPNGCS